jgi:hypothetical protein
MGSTNRWSKQMADDLTTIPRVLDALADGGPDAAEALFAGVEAGKRYIYGEGAKRGVSNPFLGPAGLTPTPREFADLLNGLAAWAVDYEPAVDPAPLLAFRQVDLSRCRTPMGNSVSGFIAVGPLPEGQWELAAQRAVEALHALTACVRKRSDKGSGPVGLDLDKVAASLGILTLRAERYEDRVQELLKHALSISEARKDRNGVQKRGGAGSKAGAAEAMSPAYQWITVTEGASLFGVDKGTISRAISDGKIESNGEKGTARRVYSVDLVRWMLERANRSERNESCAAVEKQLEKAAATKRTFQT